MTVEVMHQRYLTGENILASSTNNNKYIDESRKEGRL